MGQEIERERFDRSDFDRFEQRLRDGLDALAALLRRPGFGTGPASVGAELELALVDADGRAAHLNTEVIEKLADPAWGCELNRFGIEFGTLPALLAGRPFSALHAELSAAVERLGRTCAPLGARPVAIGTLPTLTTRDIDPSAMTASNRFRALGEGLERIKPTDLLEIDGREPLSMALPGITAEGANAALQLHLRVGPAEFARTFNAAQMATGPALAVAVNSPIFLGHVLWEETRVPLFHQAIDGHDGTDTAWRPYRVAFGHGWVREGALELLEESVALHPPLLPVCADDGGSDGEGEAPGLAELRLHNGTTWRWNRPVYDPTRGGHLRIEFRALPSGPTPRDMVANAAFLIGLTLALREESWMTIAFPFGGARRNFFAAARHGLDATLAWPSRRAPSPTPRAAPALVQELVPAARDGLVANGVDAAEADELLEVVRARAEVGMTGARWQRDTLRRHREHLPRQRALAAMLAEYVDAARSGEPLHLWPTTSLARQPAGAPIG